MAYSSRRFFTSVASVPAQQDASGGYSRSESPLLISRRDRMNLTDEQVAAIDIFRRGATAKVNAFAGTGKTTTLEHMARSRSSKGLYLAFNTSIAAEAQARFPSHVDARTTHSYAFKHLSPLLRDGSDKVGRSLNGNQIAELLTIRDIAVGSRLTITARAVGHLVARTINRFCRTGDRTISARHVPTYGKLLACDEASRDVFFDQVVELALHTWERMQTPDDPTPLDHDGYLKLWSLSQPIIDADFVLLDEAQDSNEAVLSVLAAQDCQVIYVGDRHQQIYEWRGAVNAMDKAVVNAEADLTQSFRFGQQVANVANCILSRLDESKQVIGNPVIDSRINEGYVSAVLCRTNAGVLGVVLEELSRNRVPYVQKGVDDLLRLLKDVERLRSGIPGASDEFFGFANWREVEYFAQTDDGEGIKPIVSLVRKFGESVLLKKLGRVAKHASGAEFTVSTAHKAKGLEWPGVEIYGDFVSKDERGQAQLRSGSEESRLLYVAATRAKQSLHMPQELLEALGIADTISAPVGERKFYPHTAAMQPAERSAPPQGPTSIELNRPF